MVCVINLNTVGPRLEQFVTGSFYLSSHHMSQSLTSGYSSFSCNGNSLTEVLQQLKILNDEYLMLCVCVCVCVCVYSTDNSFLYNYHQ